MEEERKEYIKKLITIEMKPTKVEEEIGDPKKWLIREKASVTKPTESRSS